MTLQGLTDSFTRRVKYKADKSFILTDRQIAYAMFLASKEGLPGLPINRGYHPLPDGGYIFRAPTY